MKKILLLVPALALTGCAATPPPSFPALNYAYLKPIIFKVSTLNVVDNYTPAPGEAALIANNPAPPEATLETMLKNRMQPSGQPGSGTITIQNASIIETDGNLVGQMVVDINLTSADGRSSGYAEASVSRSEAAPDDDDPSSADMQTALYGMTKRLMAAINVELPYQIAHNVPSWVSWTSQGGMPAAASSGVDSGAGVIQASPLTVPGGATPAAPAAMPPAAPVNSNLAVPDYLPGTGPAALGNAAQ